ncbi:MAG: bifunctional dihydroneopterin aldolase/7,8-dihydroneopterin epimerase [Candidatus Promineifilaceae bacterium]
MPSMDKILLTDLRLQGILGVEPEERQHPQEILVNVTAYTDVRAAARSDDITDAVNYAAMAERIRQHVAAGAPFLVERLAEEIAGILLAEFNIAKLRVRVEKPTAVLQARAVGVEIKRHRANIHETS